MAGGSPRSSPDESSIAAKTSSWIGCSLRWIDNGKKKRARIEIATRQATVPVTAAISARIVPVIVESEAVSSRRGVDGWELPKKFSLPVRTPSFSLLTWSVVAIACGAGVVERAWYLFHRPLNSDEAVVGLMAEQILHGHFSAFYWGQVYGGGEPYLVALLFAVFGSSWVALELTPALLSVTAALVTVLIARHLTDDRRAASLAGAVVWAAPLTAVSNSTIELGFRGVTLLCGLLVLLLALRVLDGGDGLWMFPLVGLAAGVGWWSSPEIVYFVLPAILILVGAIANDHTTRRFLRSMWRLVAMLVGAVVGALPWLWANIRSGFESLQLREFAGSSVVIPYATRLRDFFQYAIPLLLGLRVPASGKWILDYPISMAILVLVSAFLVTALAVCALRSGRYLALACSVIAFPFLYALSPATWYWRDGRYADFAFPLLVLVAVVGIDDLARRSRRWRRANLPVAVARRLFAVGMASASILLCVGSFSSIASVRTTFFARWSDPNAPIESLVSRLEHARVRDAYADYWVAYDLDFLSGGALRVATVGDDVDRWRSLDRAVLSSRRPAWLFVTSHRGTIRVFGPERDVRGPDGLSEAWFLAALEHLGIRYSVVHAGIAVAIVPNRPVAAEKIGLTCSSRCAPAVSEFRVHTV